MKFRDYLFEFNSDISSFLFAVEKSENQKLCFVDENEKFSVTVVAGTENFQSALIELQDTTDGAYNIEKIWAKNDTIFCKLEQDIDGIVDRINRRLEDKSKKVQKQKI